MTADDFRAHIGTLNTWSAGGTRAPHKPLLLLYALARFADGTEQLRYNDVESRLLRLLEDFGPPRKKVQAFSFQRLATSPLWEVNGAEPIRVTASGDWFVSDARRINPVGQFSADARRLLHAQPGLIAETAYAVLDGHFAPSLHEDILTSIGLDPESAARGTKRPSRDPAFREAVLEAYGYECAVCGFGVRVGRKLVGIEAAHVQWHSAGGPDAVPNGLALCSLHHKLLDEGAYRIEPAADQSRTLVVAASAHGSGSFDQWLMAFHRRAIAEPTRTEYRVSEPFLRWHAREVFKCRPRA